LKDAEENHGLDNQDASDDGEDKDAADEQPQEQASEKKKIVMPV
jgi:hypothetical protein